MWSEQDKTQSGFYPIHIVNFISFNKVVCTTGGGLMRMRRAEALFAFFVLCCFWAVNVQADTSVAADPPIAGLIASPLVGVPPLAVEFFDTSTGNPSYRVWFSGDTPLCYYPFDPIQKNYTYYYTVPGIDHSTLTVSNGGEDSSAGVTIRVIGSTPAVDSIKPSKHRHGGKDFNVAIHGTGFQTARSGMAIPLRHDGIVYWQDGTQVIFWRSTPTRGIITSLVCAQSESDLIALVKIPKNARPGLYNVTVINPDGQNETLKKGFRILT